MEDESMEGKDIALNEVVKEAFKKKQEADQKGEENYVNPTLMIGESIFEMDIKKDEKEGKYKMHILGIHILSLDEKNELKFEDSWEDNLTKRIGELEGMVSEKDGKDLIESLKQMDKQLEEDKDEQQERSSVQKDEEDLSEDKEEQEELEEQEKAEDGNEKEVNTKNSKYWQEMDLDREFTDSDTLRKWTKDVLGESPKKLYRHQTGPHDFEYVGEYDGGELRPLNLSTDLEGKNTTQEIYILKEDGTVEKDEVDSLMLTKDGTYGIATKIPDSGTTDMTKSFSVSRTKDGKYLATQLIERSGQNRDPKLPGKEVGDRTKSVYDKEKFLDQKDEIEKSGMEIADDGISVGEIGLYEYFKEKGYKDPEIDRMIKDMEENEISADEAESKEKDAQKREREREDEDDGQKTPWGDAEGRRSRW